MPSIQYQEIASLILSRLPLSFPSSDFTTFIETGTYMGDTIFHMNSYFKELHTIELSKILYESAKEKATTTLSNNKIQFHHGDSSVVLPELLPNITSPTIFWLDGHFCHCASEQGSKDCPLLEEISAIRDKLTSPAIIIIDDARLFNTVSAEDWSGINETSILSTLINHPSQRYVSHFYIPSHLHSQDRMIVFLNEQKK
jgi:hypothetical protein